MKQSQKKYKEQRYHGSSDFPCACYIADYSVNAPKPCDVPFHWHDQIELIHIEKGTFDYQKNVSTELITDECFLLVETGSLHKLFSEKDYYEDAVVFSPDILSFSFDDRAKRKIIHPFVTNQIHFPDKIDQSDPLFLPFKEEYQRIVDAFVSENTKVSDQYNATKAFSQLTIKTSLLRIIGLLYESGRFLEEVPENETLTERMKEVLSYIEGHYREKIYLEDLASMVGLNEQYFSRQFRKYFGKAPMKYLMEFRLRKACKRLLESDDAVTDIAYECGFRNLGHFMTEFKKLTGQTPKIYRSDNKM